MCSTWTPVRNQYPKFTVGVSNYSAKCVVSGFLGETNIRCHSIQHTFNPVIANPYGKFRILDCQVIAYPKTVNFRFWFLPGVHAPHI